LNLHDQKFTPDNLSEIREQNALEKAEEAKPEPEEDHDSFKVD
jgi:hypothetical protein